MKLLTIQEAASVLDVSTRHIQRLIAEADINNKGRWRHGREIVDLTPKTSYKRVLRINLEALVQQPQR